MRAMCNLDEAARAELLCDLVVSQLIARIRTGAWLRIDQRIESVRVWLAANGGFCDWIERAALCDISIEIASHFQSREFFAAAELAKMLINRVRLDYRRLSTQTLHNICAARLREIRGARNVTP